MTFYFSFLNRILIFDRLTWQRLAAIAFLISIFSAVPLALTFSTGHQLILVSNKTSVDFMASGNIDKQKMKQVLAGETLVPKLSTTFLLGKTYGSSMLDPGIESWKMAKTKNITSTNTSLKRWNPVFSVLNSITEDTLEKNFRWNVSLVDDASLGRDQETNVSIIVDEETAEVLNLSLTDSFYLHSNLTGREVEITIAGVIEESREDKTLQLLAKDSEYAEVGVEPLLLFDVKTFTALVMYLNNDSVTEFPIKASLDEQVEHLNRIYIFTDRERYLNPLDLSETIRNYENIKRNYDEYFSMGDVGISWLDYGLTFSHNLDTQIESTAFIGAIGSILFSPILITGLYLTALWINLSSPSLNNRLIWLKSQGMLRHQTIILLTAELSLVSIISSLPGLLGGIVLGYGISDTWETSLAFLPYFPSVILSYLIQSFFIALIVSGWVFINVLLRVEFKSPLQYLRIRTSRYLQIVNGKQEQYSMIVKVGFLLLILSIAATVGVDQWLNSLPIGALFSSLILDIARFLRTLSPLIFLMGCFGIIYFLSLVSHRLFTLIIRGMSKISIPVSTVIAFMFSSSSHHFRRTVFFFSVTFTVLFSFLVTVHTYREFLIEDAELKYGTDMTIQASTPYALVVAENPPVIVDDIAETLHSSVEIDSFTPIFEIPGGYTFFETKVETAENWSSLSNFEVIFLNTSKYRELLGSTSEKYLNKHEKYSAALLNSKQDIYIWLQPKIREYNKDDFSWNGWDKMDSNSVHQLTLRHNITQFLGYNSTLNITVYPFEYLPGIEVLQTRIGLPILIIPFSSTANFSTVLGFLVNIDWSFKSGFLVNFAENIALARQQETARQLRTLYPSTTIQTTTVDLKSGIMGDASILFLFKVFNSQIFLMAVLLTIVLGVELFFDIRLRSHDYSMLITRGAGKWQVTTGVITEMLFILLTSLILSFIFSFLMAWNIFSLLPALFTGGTKAEVHKSEFPLLYPPEVASLAMLSLGFSVVTILLAIHWLSQLSLIQTLRQFGD